MSSGSSMVEEFSSRLDLLSIDFAKGGKLKERNQLYKFYNFKYIINIL